MTLKTSVKQSLNDYMEYRRNKRELLGPDLLDTAVDISKATLAQLIPKETVTTDERSMFDRIRSGIADKKLQMADRLESITGKLRGESVDRRKTLDEEKVETPVEAREAEQEKAEDTTQKGFVKEETLEDEKKRRELLEAAETTKTPIRKVEERLRKTDDKENVTAKDYMLSGGVSAFLQHFNGSELEAVKEVAIHDVKQLESIDAQIAGIDADIKELMEIRERLSTIRENLYEKYQIGNVPTKEEYESAYAEIEKFGQEIKQDVQSSVTPGAQPEVQPEAQPKAQAQPIVHPTDVESSMTDEDLEFLQSLDELIGQHDAMQQ